MSLKKSFFISSLFALVAVLSTANAADITVCKKGNLERKVEIIYPNGADSKVPCEVRYQKEGAAPEGQRLYNATSDETYCAKQAEKFVAESLVAKGWECKGVGEP